MKKLSLLLLITIGCIYAKPLDRKYNGSGLSVDFKRLQAEIIINSTFTLDQMRQACIALGRTRAKNDDDTSN